MVKSLCSCSLWQVKRKVQMTTNTKTNTATEEDQIDAAARRKTASLCVGVLDFGVRLARRSCRAVFKPAYF
jgi:hypothetical protein